MSEFMVILFFSNNYTMWASNVLKKNRVPHKLIPIPRHMSSDCGYCVRINTSDKDIALDLMTGSDIEFDRIEAL